MKFPLRVTAFFLIAAFSFSLSAQAKPAREIDASVETAWLRFQKEVPGGKQLLERSKGVLVIPNVIKAGFVVGGEYGVGALLIKGKPREYFNLMTGSFGFQLGGQKRDVYLLFMESSALDQFRRSEGWKAGADGSVALVTLGANGSVDTTKTNAPILGFVLGQAGLMYNLTLEGSKFNRINPGDE